ncbi:DNA-directed RNA polymerase I subunit RPA43 [Vespa crabro]|uniref:DNA-directed RNA polymerase I subunit RPA43 n=1 Tax=Vespa crabro TaxID=7445 RepID=UPI001F00897A|nr:DNA-directed RNA polymerase I subunit RPA43 [Vespa crabro]
MKFRPYTGITWSLLELAGLLEDEDSHVYFERMKKHLGLHPYHMNDLGAALNEILSSGLNAYDSELQGFLLAYKNPKLLTPLGDIFYDSCFIHIDIEADFYVFRPQIGHLLKGVVHKKGANYIGVLMHKAFNVSIPKPENVENWPGDTVNIGQEVRFKVTNLDFTSRLPFIRGILNEADYLQGCKLPARVSSNGTFYAVHESDDTDNSNVEICRSTKKRKKLRKIKEDISLEKHLTKKKCLNNQDTEDEEVEENKKHSKKCITKSESIVDAENDEHLNISYDNVSYLNGNEISVKEKKKNKKSLKRKSTDISESEFDYSNVTIKVEKDTSTTDTETESKKYIKKSKKHSKKLKYSMDANGSIDYDVQNDVQSESEKHSENEFKIPIKLEKLSKSINIKEESTCHKSKSSKKQIKKSLTDSESEFGYVEIKVEDCSETECTQPYDHKKQKVKIKTEKSIVNNETDNENSFSESGKKHKRKRAETLEIELDYENVTIKKEKLDDYPSDCTSTSKKSSKNRHSNDANYNANDEYDTQNEINIKKSHKKSKVKVDLELEPQETKIKTESIR